MFSQNHKQIRARESNREYYRIQNSLHRFSERIADDENINVETYININNINILKAYNRSW